MQGAMKLRNEARAMPALTVTEGIKVLESTDPEALTATEQYFQTLWLYPASAVANGVLTANAADLYIGLSGGASTQYLPDKRAAGDTDYPVVIQMPVGAKMSLTQVRIKGSVGDGVYYRYV